jgi:cAMP phosphodiesterase
LIQFLIWKNIIATLSQTCDIYKKSTHVQQAWNVITKVQGGNYNSKCIYPSTLLLIVIIIINLIILFFIRRKSDNPTHVISISFNTI